MLYKLLYLYVWVEIVCFFNAVLFIFSLGLSKDSSELEPFFASMALYDAREKKKLSENFYFDLNTENVKRMLGGHVPYSDMSSLSRGCVFDITHLSPDLYIVVRVEKVLQGDINESIEPYLKDDKAVSKIFLSF